MVAAVVAIDHLEDRRLAGAGRAAKHDALAGLNREGDIVDNADPHTVAQMQGEGLGDAFEADELGHAASTEETRSCV
jgi:hypothetical protein